MHRYLRTAENARHETFTAAQRHRYFYRCQIICMLYPFVLSHLIRVPEQSSRYWWTQCFRLCKNHRIGLQGYRRTKHIRPTCLCICKCDALLGNSLPYFRNCLPGCIYRSQFLPFLNLPIRKRRSARTRCRYAGTPLGSCKTPRAWFDSLWC